MVGRRAEDAGWTFEKKIGVGGIVSILMLSGAVLGVYVKNDTRINSLEIALTYQKGVNDQLKESQKDIKQDTSFAITEVKQSIDKLSGKVDRLLERK